MKNQMQRIFHHSFRHNPHAVFNRRHNNQFLVRELSSSSKQKQMIRQPEDYLLNHRAYYADPSTSSHFFRHQHLTHAGIFLQQRGVHATVLDHNLPHSSSHDPGEENTSDQQVKQSIIKSAGDDRGNNEISVKLNGDPIRIKPSEKRDCKSSIYILSSLDQQVTPITTKSLYLYKSSSKGNETSVEVVKNSLSKLLSYYYPLAGKLRMNSEGKFIVECTDEGAVFIEAKANCDMEDVLSRVHLPGTVINFVYHVPGADQILDIPLMTVQVTRFNCGGFALGITMNHGMFDGISEGEFMNNWGKIARGLPLDTPPYLDRTILNSWSPTPLTNPHHGVLQLKETLKPDQSLYDENQTEYKSFVFDENKILKLKKMAMEEAGSSDGIVNEYCSTFEVITAFIWRARIKAFGIKPNDLTRLLFAVNIRSKLNHHLPKGFFGNGIVLTNSLCTAGELVEKKFSYGVKLIQEAKNMVNEEYARSYIEYFENSMFFQTYTTTLVISSSCQLDFRKMDIGWGEPIHCDPVVLAGRQLTMFLPHGKDNKGVIVKLGLPPLVMKTFEQLMIQI